MSEDTPRYINRDAEGNSVICPVMYAYAQRNNLHVVDVQIDEPGAKHGDETAITFPAVMSFLPRVGELLLTADGRPCVVRLVGWAPITIDGFEFVQLIPTVRAVLHA